MATQPPISTTTLLLCGEFTDAVFNRLDQIADTIPDHDWVAFQAAAMPFMGPAPIPENQIITAIDRLVPLCRRVFSPSDLKNLIPNGLKTTHAIGELTAHRAHDLARLCGVNPVNP